MEILHELVATADVVQHNMRYDAAVRLGVDYESLRAIKPDLDLLPHARLRARRARGPARQRPDRRRAGGPRLARRRPRPRRQPALAGGVAGRHRQRLPVGHRRWCRRSTTATAPARGSSSTRRSCTRSCSTRRSRGAWPTAAATATVRSLDAMQLGAPRHPTALRDRRRLAVHRRGDRRAAQRAGVGAGRRQGQRRHHVRGVGAGVPHPERGAVVRERSTPPACLRGVDAPTSSSGCSTIPR